YRLGRRLVPRSRELAPQLVRGIRRRRRRRDRCGLRLTPAIPVPEGADSERDHCELGQPAPGAVGPRPPGYGLATPNRWYHSAASCFAQAPPVPGGAFERRGRLRPKEGEDGNVTEYEILLLLDPELDDDRQGEIVTRARELVERGGGTWDLH